MVTSLAGYTVTVASVPGRREQAWVKSECLARLLGEYSGLSALCHLPGPGILIWQGVDSRIVIVALVNVVGVSHLTLEFWCWWYELKLSV